MQNEKSGIPVTFFAKIFNNPKNRSKFLITDFDPKISKTIGHFSRICIEETKKRSRLTTVIETGCLLSVVLAPVASLEKISRCRRRISGATSMLSSRHSLYSSFLPCTSLHPAPRVRQRRTKRASAHFETKRKKTKRK